MAQETSTTLLARLSTYYKDIDLTLRQDYWDLLSDLGNPHLNLPPVFHVAGTNGKGSTVAFLRAMLEAAGYRVHAYTSPHLVTFHERIRLAGTLISEEKLVDILKLCESKIGARKLTQFEVTTAAAFYAFAHNPADVLILETGMGGRLDSTNVIPSPVASIITRISYDHQAFLGDTLEAIASEKAGIFKSGAPAIVGPQADKNINAVFEEKAAALNIPLFLHGRDWTYTVLENGFAFSGMGRDFSLPRPALLGAHQYANAATAIAALCTQKTFNVDEGALQKGTQNAQWPARLQRLSHGPLFKFIPTDWEVWLDGGHNDSAGQALAIQTKDWSEQDEKPLLLVAGMINTKNPTDFFAPLAPYTKALACIPIPEEEKSLPANRVAQAAQQAGIVAASAHDTPEQALLALAQQQKGPARVLITGSLYLAGYILREQY